MADPPGSSCLYAWRSHGSLGRVGQPLVVGDQRAVDVGDNEFDVGHAG